MTTTILVGKNAHHNDELCKNMNAADYWFHATEYPGAAHVIVGIDVEKPICAPPGQVIAKNRRHFIVSKM